jgi:site-specific DNA-methyltransferase (adenine-specific)
VGGLHELRNYGEPGAMVYLADCVELMRLIRVACVDVIFADPPYRLSGGGVTVKSGRVATADKGEWDRSLGALGKTTLSELWLFAPLTQAFDCCLRRPSCRLE